MVIVLDELGPSYSLLLTEDFHILIQGVEPRQDAFAIEHLF